MDYEGLLSKLQGVLGQGNEHPGFGTGNLEEKVIEAIEEKRRLEVQMQLEEGEIKLRMFSMEIAVKLAASDEKVLTFTELCVLAEQVKEYVIGGVCADRSRIEKKLRSIGTPQTLGEE